jgi:hypothetical protein
MSSRYIQKKKHKQFSFNDFNNENERKKNGTLHCKLDGNYSDVKQERLKKYYFAMHFFFAQKILKIENLK